MADVTFHNVQHGEYISIAMKTEKNEDLTVIRDFGAYSTFLTPFLKIEADKMATDENLKEAILSHAHKDHCNGFELLHKNCRGSDGMMHHYPFRKAYIPYLRYDDARDLGALMLKSGLYLLCLLPKTSERKGRITNWIRMTPIMYDLSQQLVSVYQGVELPDWMPKGKVLWPPQISSDYYANQVAELEEMTIRLHDVLLQANINLDTPDNTYEELRKLLASLGSQNKNAPQLSALAQIEAILNPYLKACNSAKVSAEERKVANKIYDNYKPTIDNHSIVFSLCAEKEGEGALFLSDLDGDTMDDMCKSITLNKHYQLIKSAHHGTRLGTCLETSVKADTVVHCCGHGNSRYHGPDPAYQNVAVTDILCSDWVYNNKPKWQLKPSYKLFNSNKHTISI